MRQALRNGLTCRKCRRLNRLVYRLLIKSSEARIQTTYTQVSFEKLPSVDPPPSHVPNDLSRTSELASFLREVCSFFLTPIYELRELLVPSISKFLRPRLQKDHTRIEWMCVSSPCPPSDTSNSTRAVGIFCMATI